MRTRLKMYISCKPFLMCSDRNHKIQWWYKQFYLWIKKHVSFFPLRNNVVPCICLRALWHIHGPILVTRFSKRRKSDHGCHNALRHIHGTTLFLKGKNDTCLFFYRIAICALFLSYCDMHAAGCARFAWRSDVTSCDGLTSRRVTVWRHVVWRFDVTFHQANPSHKTYTYQNLSIQTISHRWRMAISLLFVTCNDFCFHMKLWRRIKYTYVPNRFSSHVTMGRVPSMLYMRLF